MRRRRRSEQEAGELVQIVLDSRILRRRSERRTSRRLLLKQGAGQLSDTLESRCSVRTPCQTLPPTAFTPLISPADDNSDTVFSPSTADRGLLTSLESVQR